MKQWYSFALVFLSIASISVFVGGDALASLAWQKYRSPKIAILLVRDDVELTMSIGNYYFNGGAYDLETAGRAYRKAVSINPKVLWGHYQLARIYFVKGNYEQALEEINRELEANPENLRSLYIRGLIYGYRNQVGLPAQAGDLELAENDFRRFTYWAPSEWAGYNDLAWILSKEAKYQDAKDTVLLALSRTTDVERNPWLWNALGLAELNLGEYEAAKESFEKAQSAAATLSREDWQKSYPGNSPNGAEAGLTAFRETIRSNLEKTNSFLQ